jgi:hypothetical protein
MSILDTVESMYPEKFKKESNRSKSKTAFDLQLEKECKRERYQQQQAGLNQSREAYEQRHPETKSVQTWRNVKGTALPHYEAEVCVKNSTAVKNEIFRNMPRFKSLRSAALGLLLYFIYHRNYPDKKDKHNTREVWYHQRGLIVASRSLGTMASDFGVARSTIKDWIDALEMDGLVKRELENRENVYVIGKIVDRKEVYFYAQTAADS